MSKLKGLENDEVLRVGYCPQCKRITLIISSPYRQAQYCVICGSFFKEWLGGYKLKEKKED